MKHKSNYYIKLAIVNILTSVRLFGSFILPFVYFYTRNSFKVSIWVLLIFSTDLYDGFLARIWKVQSFFGGLLDSVSDKFISIVSLGILSLMKRVMVIPLLLELAIMIVNFFAYKDNKNIQSSKIGKRKTLLLGGTIVLSFILLASPAYIEFLPTIFIGFINSYHKIAIYILAGMIIGMQLIVLTDYSKKAFKQNKSFTIKGKKLLPYNELKMVLFDNDFYVANKDKPLRTILYRN